MSILNPVIVKKEQEASIGGDYLVKFIDYDGTILKSQWVNSGEDATAPTPLIHSLLTFVEWNNTFTNVTSNINVGATYKTTDDSTYLFCFFTNALSGLQPTLNLTKATTALMTIDWGDSTTNTTTSSGNVSIQKTAPYATDGDYLIKITCSAGYGFQALFLGNNATYSKAVKHIFISDYVTSLGINNMLYLHSLMTVSIPKNVTSLGANCFYDCYSLKCVVIPIACTSIGSACFNACYSFIYCCISSGVTSIGDNAFVNCYSHESITIMNTSCTVGASCFQANYDLKHVKLPNLASLNASTFTANYSLPNQIIPSTITTIGANCFLNNYSCIDYQILATTPPTLTAGSFSGLKITTKIYVPDASVTAYKTATNWSTYANYIYPISTRA